MSNFSDLIGVPYCPNGRSKKNGFDCYGLVIEAVRRDGKELRDVVYDSRDESLSDENAPLLNIKQTDNIKAGCIIEMRHNGKLHIGYALDSKVMLHCTENQGVRVSAINKKLVHKIYEVL